MPSDQKHGDAASEIAPGLSFLNTSARRLVTNQRDKTRLFDVIKANRFNNTG